MGCSAHLIYQYLLTQLRGGWFFEKDFRKVWKKHFMQRILITLYHSL